METVPRKAVTLYVEKSSWLKSNLEPVLSIELLPEGRLRIQRKIGIGMKGIPDKIVKDQNLNDGPVQIEVVRHDHASDEAVDVYVSQIQEIAASGTVWVVSTIRSRLVFSGKTERGMMARELVRQAILTLGSHPRAQGLDDDTEVMPRSTKRPRTTQNTPA